MIATVSQITQLNASAPSDPYLGTLVHRTPNVIKAQYDFAVFGGAAAGSFSLKDDLGNLVKIPAKAIVTRVFLDVQTPCVGAGSGQLDLESAHDLLAATAAASITGLLEGTPVGTAATMVKTTVERQLKFTLTVGTLTAGKFNVFLYYVLGD